MTDNPKCAEYEFRSDKEKFYDAKRNCSKKGMKLLTHFQGHYDALRDCRKGEDEYWIGLVQRRESQCFLNSSLYFWVGNNKRCVNPKTELQDIGDGNVQPLNKNEECQAIVITLSKQKASDKYNSKKCDLEEHKYICQKQLNNPSSTDSGKTSSTPQSYFPSHKSPPSEETTTHFKNTNPPSNVAMLVVVGVLVSLIVLLFVLIFRRSKKWKTLCKSNKKATKRTETEEPIYSRYGL